MSIGGESLADGLKISKRTAYIAILAMGIVSMLGDIVYESGRGIAPDYLLFLGASALLVGAVSGVGEFVGYSARLVSGSLSDRSKAYWLFIFAGYGLILAIPLMGFTFSLELVIVLLLLERLGKALRSPSRDTVVSIISKNVGTGKAFGLHEAIDQIGAIIGPLIFSAVLLFTANSYPAAFGFLLIPFALMVMAIIYTYRKVGKSVEAEVVKDIDEKVPLSCGFWIYCLAVFLNTLGLIPVALILFSGSLILQPLGQAWMVPLLYVVVQAVDAPMALVSGHLFDKLGMKILALPFVLSVFPVLLVSFGGLAGVIAACVMFGLVLGMQESIYRAAVCEFIPLCKRGTAYGVFNTVLGVGTLASGVIFGFLLDYGYSWIVLAGLVLLLQVGAIVTLNRARTSFQTPANPSI
ncbi:MAG: MFS transporter [Candidatus Bathyarchaeota archaeon]|nr:MFS transporter [Candidatus Bathyarchaeota archaeon]